MNHARLILLAACMGALFLLAVWAPWNSLVVKKAPVITTDLEAAKAALAFVARLHLPTDQHDISKPADISTSRFKSAKQWEVAWAAKTDPSITNRLAVLVYESGDLTFFPYFEGYIDRAEIFTNSVYYTEKRRSAEQLP